MTTPQRLVVALVFVIAVVGGGALTFLLLGGSGGGPVASTSPVADSTPTPLASILPSDGATV